MSNIEREIFGCHIFGTDSGAWIDPFGPTPVTIYSEIDQQLFDMKPANIPQVKSMHTEEVVAFINAIQSGGVSPVPGEQGLILNAVFDALYKSSETGKEEAVDLTI